MKSKLLYLDNTSTTLVNPEILDTYVKINQTYFASSNSLYSLGLEVSKLENIAKKQILDLLQIKNYDIIFTSGATEANNIGIKDVALKYQSQGKHLITSNVEHPSVLNSFKYLEDHHNFEVTYLPVDQNGQIDFKQLKNSLRSDTILVSIMAVNNEIGSIIDFSKWSKIVKENSKAFTLVDMVAAVGKIDLDFINIDMATFSAHKIFGLKGSGVLIKRDYIETLPQLSGGSQQANFRAGTSDSAANITFAKTLRMALENKEQKNQKLKQLNEYFIDKLRSIDMISINTNPKFSIFDIINFSVLNVKSEIVMNHLANKNIFVSAGSTCQSKLYEDSRVLKALNKSEVEQQGRIRLTLNEQLSIEDLDYIINTLKEIIENYAV